MEKKNLKWYEAPAMEFVNVNVETRLLDGSPILGGSDDMDPVPDFGS